MTFTDWLKLARAEHGIIALAGVFVGASVAARSFNAGYLLAGLGPLLITWGSFMLNDYFDVVSDAALKRRDRPLVGGAIKPQHALWAGALLMVAGVGAVVPFGFIPTSVAAAFAIAAIAYDAFLKRMPLVGNIFIALSMAVPFVFGMAVANAFNQTIVVLSAIAFVTGLGREQFITARDVEGDRKLGAKTLPMVIGVKNTLLFGSLLFLLAIAASAIPALRGAGVAYVAFVGACDIILGYCIWLGLNNPDAHSFNKIRNLSLASLALGLVGFASLALN